jgi:RNA polymerase sigma-70 factor (ECF subfamily)
VDAEWVGEALTRYEGPLIRYALRFTGNVESARDVVQDTFLRLCKAKRAQVDGRLAAWLYTVCRNRALDVTKKERRTMPMDEAVIAQTPSDAPPPSAMAEARDAQGVVTRIIATLPERQQEVIRLKFQDALSYREISQITGHSESNVGYLLHTAIKKVRQCVQEQTDLLDEV